MQTAGFLLKQARLKKKLTFTQVVAKTKIPKSSLEALEKNQLQKLPPETYIHGFIKNYSKLVGLDPKKTIAIFRRDYHQTKKKKLIPKGLTKPLNSRFSPTPTLRTILTILLVVLAFFAYLGFSFFRLTSPPKLIVNKPENTVTTTSPVLVKGQTDRDATLTLNGKTINLEPDGRFTTVFNGLSGTHKLKFIATSRRNKSTETIRYVIISN